MLSRSVILAFGTVAFASVLPSTIEKRYCGTVLTPTSLHSLQQQFPDEVFPNTIGTTNQFYVSQNYDAEAGILVNIVNQLAYFEGPPPPAYGCQLGISFPPDYPFNPYNGNQLNVYTVPTPLPPTGPTYNNIVPNEFLFGTITIVPGQTAVINSHVCPTAGEGGLAYVFSYPEWSIETSNIGWIQGGDPTEGITGIYLSYNC